MDSRGGSIAEELPKNGTDCPFCLPEFDESQQQPSPAAAKNTAPTLNKYDQYAMQPKLKFHLSNTVDGVHVRSRVARYPTQSRTSYDVGRRGERSHFDEASGADQLYRLPRKQALLWYS
jgi:hypothetical protein